MAGINRGPSAAAGSNSPLEAALPRLGGAIFWRRRAGAGRGLDRARLPRPVGRCDGVWRACRLGVVLAALGSAQGGGAAGARHGAVRTAGLGHTGASAPAFMAAQEAALAHRDAEDGEALDSGGVPAAAGAGGAPMGSARAIGTGWTGLGCGTVVQHRLCKRAGSTSGLQPTGLIGPDWFSWAAGCCGLAEIRGEMKGREQTSRWAESIHWPTIREGIGEETRISFYFQKIFS
jgi:hypothetical protein